MTKVRPMLRMAKFAWLPLVGLVGAATPVTPTINPTAFALTFQEDFTKLDRETPTKLGRWRTSFGYGGPTSKDNRTLTNNAEQQAYVEPEYQNLGINPFSLTPGGGVTITAAPTPKAAKSRLWEQPYTSGLLTTKGSFNQQYGYFEMVAQLPHGKGLWPAFWLLPSAGGWPPEIDIMENLAHDSRNYYATLHTKNGPSIGHRAGSGENLASGMHSYGAAWSKDWIVFYLDRKEFTREKTPADMNQPMYMLVNLAVGGKWPGSPDATTIFPAAYKVKSIKVWKLPANWKP